MATCSRALPPRLPGRTVRLLAFALIAHAAAAGPVDFARDIQPLLNEHCLKCHGGVKEAGEMNLQFREDALKAGESGAAAIVPGHPEGSEFIARLVTDDKTERMPRKAPSLSEPEIALFRRWIAEGAPWRKHWAYEPPHASSLGIDTLVETRLQQEHLTLSPEADRWTLARRTALDLTGLPPSPEEAQAFVQDPAPDAYAHWVDRLLASPAYGERWAPVWLDLARYADSKGYEKDGFRDMWRYRDYVIDAFNSDKPYNDFVVEQLAGDLLPEPTAEQIIATAFHRNTLANDEGGTDDEEFRTYAVLDRVNTTFDGLQGTTIGCVQCHGHPYDAFRHREYYELMAFFNNTADADKGDDGPVRRFFSREDTVRAAEIEQHLNLARQQLAGEVARPENQAAFATWVRTAQFTETVAPLREVSVGSTQGTYAVKAEGRLQLASAPPDRTTIEIEGTLGVSRSNALVLELLPADSLPGQGPGASEGAGNFILTKLHAVLLKPGEAPAPLELTQARATYEQDGWPVAEALRSGESALKQGESGWAIAGGTGREQKATFLLAQPLEVTAGTKLQVTLECENERWPHHILGSFRIGTAEVSTAEPTAKLPKEVSEVLSRPMAKWKPEERTKVERQFFSSLKPEFAARYQAVERESAALAALPACNLPIMQELTGTAARTTKLFHRGNWMDQTEPVQPHTPQVLNAWHEDYPRNRLGFARWLTNGENPLTARVQVNRVWEQLFGAGLVETLEDFGSQGDRPIYPELLDALAVRFQGELQWSQKKLLREIVLSRVYRQVSSVSPELRERDPANRLLARGPRFRLSSEAIRDQALAAGGILNHKMAGPPAMPYQPPGIWQTPYEGRDWSTASGEESHRRGVYTFIRRSATYPSMITFDAPTRETCLVRRMRTNTPLQALDLLNSPVYMEAAAGLGRRMVEEGGTELEGQLACGLQIATGHPAKPVQMAVLRKLHTRVGGDLTLVANAILNSDDVLNKN